MQMAVLNKDGPVQRVTSRLLCWSVVLRSSFPATLRIALLFSIIEKDRASIGIVQTYDHDVTLGSHATPQIVDHNTCAHDVIWLNFGIASLNGEQILVVHPKAPEPKVLRGKHNAGRTNY
jgi:hypothetical protein